MSSARPRKADMPPMVAMKGGILKRVMTSPCNNPPTSPTSEATRIAPPTPMPVVSPAPAASNVPPLYRYAATMPASARSEPTDRSMPPVRMTKVIPTAISP